MAEIGETLREARMRRRIDMTEVETATKIRGKYLRALENEEWDLLPGPTFVKTFLRTYADYLGLDARNLVELTRARELWVQHRRSFGARRIDVGDAWQFLIMDVDQRQRFFGDRRTFRRDHGHRLADKPNPIDRHDGAVAQAVAVIGIDIAQIGARKYCGHARQRFGPPAIDRLNLGMRYRAAQHTGFEHVGQCDVCRKLRRAGDLFKAVDAWSGDTYGHKGVCAVTSPS